MRHWTAFKSALPVWLLLLAGLATRLPAADGESVSLNVAIRAEEEVTDIPARLYIYSLSRREFFGTREAKGNTTLVLPEGDYRIYAGLAVTVNGVIDHYASPEARVRLTAAEPCSVILVLQKSDFTDVFLNNEMVRRTLGIDEETAKYLN